MDRHFSEVASRYRELRTLDPEPLLCIRDGLPRRPSLGVDICCGTGRYTEQLYEELPQGSLILAVDLNWQMLRIFKSCRQAGARIWPIQARAEVLPLSPASMDWATAFNAVHHLELARFLHATTAILRPGGKLFVYTRTPEQNARTVWGRFFPGFTEKENRLLSESELRQAVESTAGLAIESVEAFRYERTNTPERLREQAENAHYSTFCLYESKEFPEALDAFLRQLPGRVVEWCDENLMLICRRTT